MEKRVIVAIALSLAVWLVWGFFSKPDLTKNQVTQPVATEQKQETPANTKAQPAAEVKQTPRTALAVKKTITQEIKSPITVKAYEMVLSNKGAKIESLKYSDRKIELVAGSEQKEMQVKGYLDFPVYFSEQELLSGSSLDDELWELVKADSKEAIYSIITDVAGSPLKIEKIFQFNDGYSFDLTYRITNISTRATSLENGTVYLSTPDFLGPQMKNYTGYYNAPSHIFVLEGSDSLQKGSGFFAKASDIKKKENPKWAGIMSRFITLAMIPQDFKAEKVVWDNRKTHGFRTSLRSNVGTLDAGKTVEKKIRVCIAEKKKDILVGVDPALKPATDINKWIEPIRWVVIKCLLWIEKLVGNFGIAIIIFSFVTKFIFLPLTIKSTESMKKMGELSPKMAELKEKYKDKPDQLQKATMELYKTAGVNPLGGCLPLLIQMPFFFALYSALSNSIDMWQAPFFGWITDLSMPDTVTQIMGINLNILPILMTLTTYVQQKFTAVDTGNPSQKLMMTLMPLMMIWIFWSMPSGLVLYWIIQNTLQIAHQFYVMKKPKKA